MSIADHFEHIPDAGLVRDYNGGIARRQFKMSLLMIAVLALAVVALGYVVKFDTPQDNASFGTIGTPPAYAGKL